MGILCLPEEAYLDCLGYQIKDNSSTKAFMDAMRNVPFDLVLQEHVANIKSSKGKKVAKSWAPTSKKPEIKSNGLTKVKDAISQKVNNDTTRLATMKHMSEIQGERADGLNEKQGVKPDMQTETCHGDEAAVCNTFFPNFTLTRFNHFVKSALLTRSIKVKINRQICNREIVLVSAF